MLAEAVSPEAEEEVVVAVDVNAASSPALPVAPLWLAAFVGFSLFYIADPGLIPSQWRWLFKIIPILLLLQLALSKSTGTVRKWLVVALLCTIFIVPNAGNMKVPVIAYMIAISLMAITAGFRVDSKFLWVALGALIFMVSDTLIAVSRFVAPFDYSGVAVMSTYYLAQLLICTGVLRRT